MKATRIQVDPIESTTLGVANSQMSWQLRGTLLVRVHTAGAVGVGEACPLAGYAPRRIEEAARELAAVSSLSPPTLTAPEEVFEWVARHIGEQNTGARFALETAWLDAIAQERGCPVWALFVDPHGANTEIRHTMLLPRSDTLLAAARAKRRGAVGFKLKVGFAGEAPLEHELARALKSTYPTVPLRIDANGLLTLAEWNQYMSDLGDVELDFFEEPIRREDIPWPRTKTPFALDESLQLRYLSDSLRRWALSPDGCQVFVFKPTALGGWSRCLRLLTEAREHGIDCIASHTFGGAVEFAACHHLAVVCQQGHSRSAGLGPHAGLAGSPFRFDPAGLANAPGLGVKEKPLRISG